MGCVPQKSGKKKEPRPSQVLSAYKRPLINFSRYSTSSIFGTILKVDSEGKSKCMQIRIVEKAPKFVRKELNLKKTQLYAPSLEFLDFFTEIKKLYIDYTGAYRNFCNSIHDACIPNFNLTSGLEVMMLSILANKNISLVILNTTPFVQLEGNLAEKSEKIAQNWFLLAKIFKDVKEFSDGKKEEIKKLQSFCLELEDFSTFVLKPDRIVRAKKVVASCLESFIKMREENEKLVKESEDFFRNFDVETAKNEKNCLVSGKKIVHWLIQMNN